LQWVKPLVYPTSRRNHRKSLSVGNEMMSARIRRVSCWKVWISERQQRARVLLDRQRARRRVARMAVMISSRRGINQWLHPLQRANPPRPHLPARYPPDSCAHHLVSDAQALPCTFAQRRTRIVLWRPRLLVASPAPNHESRRQCVCDRFLHTSWWIPSVVKRRRQSTIRVLRCAKVQDALPPTFMVRSWASDQESRLVELEELECQSSLRSHQCRSVSTSVSTALAFIETWASTSPLFGRR
jgi:hypothetical protein